MDRCVAMELRASIGQFLLITSTFSYRHGTKAVIFQKNIIIVTSQHKKMILNTKRENLKQKFWAIMMLTNGDLQCIRHLIGQTLAIPHVERYTQLF